jgi:dipeptidyl aminopeptidase/acylaminoacyl peptidase
VSPDAEDVLAIYSHYGVLRELVHVDVASGEQVALTDSHPEKAHALTEPIPQFFTYENRHGHEIHGVLWLPEDLERDDERPLLVYVYGGPLGSGSKTVVDGSYSSAHYFFHHYLTKHYGYVTCAIDPRGQSGYGAVFEKASFDQVGVPQTQDLEDGVKYLAEEVGGIDEDRVGIHGWSFGGFQAQMCLYTAPETFAVGIAGAGPTEWENYNSWYAQGVIGDTRIGQADLAEHSLVPRAEDLEGRLLLIHGMKDSNVLYQDTVKVYAALLDAGKGPLVDLFLDPAGGHGLGGHVKRLQQYQVYEDFLLRTLGTAAGAPIVPGLEEMRPSADAPEEEDEDTGESGGEDEDSEEDPTPAAILVGNR